MKKHENRAHALLSASGASRWMGCPPSARLEENFKDSTSDFAAEGTLAHEWAEAKLRLRLSIISVDEYREVLKSVRMHRLHTEEMEEHVEKYVDFVWAEYQAIKESGGVLLIEQKLDLTEYIPDGFGTGDATIVADKKLRIIDLKYGKGVRVDADDNAQLKLYGLGAYLENELSYDIKSVVLTIVQPRLNHISEFEISVKDLLDWAENEVKPKAKLAYAGEGKKTAGSHCKWCKAKAQCRELADYSTALLKVDFEEPDLLTDEEVLVVYNKIPTMLDWAKAVQDWVFDEALKGKKWDGYKLVAGISRRKWLDDEKVKTELIKKEFELKVITETKLLGITKIEKLVGKKAFIPLLGDLVIKPEGAPTLVKNSDKRRELNRSEDMKKEFNDNE